MYRTILNPTKALSRLLTSNEKKCGRGGVRPCRIVFVKRIQRDIGLLNCEQFDFEHQDFIRSNRALASSLAVGQFGRNVQHPFVADFHLLQRHLPTFDDLIDAEGCWLASLNGTIKDLSTDQLAGVMYPDRVG